MDFGSNRKLSIYFVVICLILIPIFFVVPEVYSATDHPDGVVTQPEFLQQDSNKFILVILDGVGTDVMLDEDMMPLLNSKQDDYAKLSITTGPLTLSATCVKEIMTGVPNDPVDGLNNFDLKHPGGLDPWILAANDPDNDVVMIGSYVMGNMYDSIDEIDFIYTFKGHSDYYEGDAETYDLVLSINENNSHDTISAHFSGPDKVGHTWGIDSVEYAEKMLHVDKQVDDMIERLGNDWNIIITADHGMTDSGTHGSAELVTRDVTAFVKGPDIVPGTYQFGIQRDLSALTAVLLNQPLPVQLNGRIPIDILDFDYAEKTAIERWNWEAATQRYAFFNGENSDVEIADIDWESISDETKFDDNSDTSFTFAIWIIAIIYCLYLFKPIMSDGNMFVLESVTFASFVGILVYSQDRLDFSAMIPRGLGAACAVYLSSVALSQFIDRKSKSSQPNPLLPVLLSPMIIPYIVVGLFLLSGDVSKSILIGTMAWAVIYPLYKFQFKENLNPKFKFSNGFYWVMAIACLTFSGMRLWFMLIPMFFFAIKSAKDYWRTSSTLTDNIQTIVLSLLLFISLIFVNNRITGYHVMNRMLRMGWPVDSVDVVILTILVAIVIGLSDKLSSAEYDLIATAKHVGYCILCFFSLVSESTYFDRMVILLLLIGYTIGLKLYTDKATKSKGKDLLRIVIASHVMVIWGVWSAIVVLLLLPCVNILMEKFAKKINWSEINVSDPKFFVALALTPWMIWILWWTLLGQVNGIQTCAEGICPHPRELDLGRVQVRGGYFGDRVNPELNWMILMISAPIVIVSSWLMYVVRSSGMSLKPYMISQLLLVIGSLNILAFSTDSPRLLFSVTWNLVFAMFQVLFAVIAEIIYRYSGSVQPVGVESSMEFA